MSDFDKWWGNDEPEKELIEFRQFKNTAQEAWAEGYKAGQQSQQPSAESPISKIELSMWLEELEEQVDDAVAGDCPHTEYSARVRLATIKQLTEGD